MKEEEREKLLNKGEKLYDAFIEKMFGRNRMKVAVPNPRTNTLELFAVLNKRREKDLLIGAMCSEISKAIMPEGVFAENGKLFKNERVKELF